MKITVISDTHGQHNLLTHLPEADMIIHCGDVSWAGTIDEVVDFINWFEALDCKYKIFIGGNHDNSLEGKSAERIQRLLPENCFYLANNGITIEGIKFWGVPFFMSDEMNGKSQQLISEIPDDIDILITHRPPLGILSSSVGIDYGCANLLQTVLKIMPHYHLFGHIHDAYGMETSQKTTFVNASVLDHTYKLCNNPILITI